MIEMAESRSLSREAAARIEDLVHRTESLQDPAARALAVDLVRAVMELHGAALRRIVEVVSSGEKRESLGELLSDDLVASVLVLHGAHPEDVDARVARAMSKLARHFDSRGAGVELLELSEELVRVRYTGRASHAAAVRQTIEDAICEAAPEIVSVVVEGVEEGVGERRETGFVPLSALTAAPL